MPSVYRVIRYLNLSMSHVQRGVVRMAWRNRRRLLAATITLWATQTHAATFTWDNGATDLLWGSTDNWNPNGLPTSADTANLSQTTARTIDLNAMTFEAGILGFTGNTSGATTLNNGVLSLDRINRTIDDNNRLVRATTDPTISLDIQALGTTIEINNTNTTSFLGIEGRITATNFDLISTNTGRVVLGQATVFTAADNNAVSNWNVAGGVLETRSVPGATFDYNSLGTGVVNLSNSAQLDLRANTSYVYGNTINIAGTNTINVNRSGGTSTGQNITVGQIAFVGANRSLAITNGNSFNLISNASLVLADNLVLDNNPNFTVPSITSTGAATTIDKSGTGNFVIQGAGVNFAGTTTVNVSEGTLTSSNNASLGTNAAVTVTGTRSVYSQNGAALAGFTYNVAAGNMIAGNNAFLNTLDLAANLTVAANGAIVQSQVGGNISVDNLPATPQYFFGISANLTESVAVGTGTPWIGITSDRGSRTYTGTITANSDFSLQGGGTLVLGNTTVATTGPTVATVTGATVQINGTPGYNSDLTFEVASGATLQPVIDNSFGTNVDPALNAKVVVLSGGTLNPNGGNKVSGNATIQPGGILLLDDANNLGGSGTITQSAGSITRITNNGTTVLGGAQSPGTVAGSIIRLETNDIRNMATVINNAAIFQVTAGNRTLADNTIDGGVLTNDGSSRSTTNTGTTTINTLTVGANGATIAATTGTTYTMNLITSNTTGGYEINGGKLTFGSTTPIAGLDKEGIVAWGAAAGFAVDVAEVEIAAGTLQGLGGGMTFTVGGGTGLVTVNSGATLDSRTGTLTNGTVNVLSGATARFRSANGTDNTIAAANVAGLQGAGNVFVGRNDTGTNRDVNLNIGVNNQNTVFSGIIADADATRNGRITKVGTGILELSGANTYTLGTVVDAGTLLVTNTTGSGTGSGDVTVNDATLGGNGTISGAVTLSGTSFLVPGTSPGTLSTGALTLSAATTSVFELTAGNTAIGSGINDLVIATDLTLDGTLNPIFLGAGNMTGDYVLFDYSGTLIDNGLSIDPLFLANPNVSSASIVIDPVNSQVLLSVTAIPEPSTWVLGSLTMLGLAGVRLRRRLA